MTYYKVLLQDGRPCVRGGPKWSLPFQYDVHEVVTPGLWHTVVGPLVACRNGLHVVTAAYVKWWWNPGRRVFEVEIPRGTERTHHDRGGNRKLVVRTARLTREVKAGTTEWALFGLPETPHVQ